MTQGFSKWLAPGFSFAPGDSPSSSRPPGAGVLELRPDLDQVEALAPERGELWARLQSVTFLTDDEKRAVIGYESVSPAPGDSPSFAPSDSPAGSRPEGAGVGPGAVKFNPYHDELGRFTFADGAGSGGGLGGSLTGGPSSVGLGGNGRDATNTGSQNQTTVAAAEGPKIVGRAARDFGTRVNTPSARDVKVKMEHVLESHTVQGAVYRQSIRDNGSKTAFPERMTPKEIERAVREAYSNSREVSPPQYNPDGKIRLLEGESGGLTIRMYYNATTKTIDSAFTR